MTKKKIVWLVRWLKWVRENNKIKMSRRPMERTLQGMPSYKCHRQLFKKIKHL